MTTTTVIRATLVQRYDSFNRMHWWRLAVRSVDAGDAYAALNNLPMGTTWEAAKEAVGRLNTRRRELGLALVVLD